MLFSTNKKGKERAKHQEAPQKRVTVRNRTLGVSVYEQTTIAQTLLI